MKITRFLLLSTVLIALSCSKDKDPEPSLEEKSLSFTSDAEVITAPSAMLTSDDPQAQMAAAWIQQANVMSTYFQFLQKPAGAAKSSTKITASNGRTKATGDHLTYTWSDANSGYSIGYQISEESDSYVFEIFFKLQDEDDWLKYFHATEKKDKSSGSLKIYDIFEITGSASNVFLNYAWTRNADILDLTISDYSGDFEIALEINEKTKAGSVTYNIDGIKTYDMTWDTKGNGTWAHYSEDGEIESQGSWTA